MGAAIDEAAEDSIRTCEVCGAPGELKERNFWWGAPLQGARDVAAVGQVRVAGADAMIRSAQARQLRLPRRLRPGHRMHRRRERGRWHRRRQDVPALQQGLLPAFTAELAAPALRTAATTGARSTRAPWSCAARSGRCCSTPSKPWTTSTAASPSTEEHTPSQKSEAHPPAPPDTGAGPAARRGGGAALRPRGSRVAWRPLLRVSSYGRIQ